MFCLTKFTFCSILFCLLVTKKSISLAQYIDEEGSIDSDNPKIDGEDDETDEPDVMQCDHGEATDAIPSKLGKWPQTPRTKEVIIPYEIDQASNYTATQMALIRQSMDDIEKYTCIRFVQRTQQKDYLQVHSGEGCSSFIGRRRGKQDVSLRKNGCMIRNKIVHEFIHAIGFDHMHDRYDRDAYITVLWQNIKDNNKRSFKKKDNKWQAFDTKYDYLSCMHYLRNDFSKNGNDTIQTKDPKYLDQIGRAATLSKADAFRINRMYNCPARNNTIN